MVEDSVETGQRDELLANVRRLTRIVLDRLENGATEGTLDQGQVRMLGSIALRSLKLWKEAVGGGVARPSALKQLLSTEEKLAGSMKRGGQA